MIDRFSNLILEQYVLGELSVNAADEVEKELAVNDELRKRVNAILASNSEINDVYDEQTVIREINYRLKTREIKKQQAQEKPASNLFWNKLAYAIPVVAIVAVSAIMFNNGAPDLNPDLIVSEDGVRIKGLTPHLNIYLQTKTGHEQLREHQNLREGDTLQLSYVAAGFQYGVIVSIDGRGIVTQHFPFEEATLFKMNPSGEFMLQRAYELDDAPEFEHFFFITSNQKFQLDDIMRIIENSAKIVDKNMRLIEGLPEQFEQNVFTIKKVTQ